VVTNKLCGESGCPAPDAGCAGECVWTCGRGRTRLDCRLSERCGDDVRIDVLRNNRLYGTYQFAGRTAALAFASRLRDSFAGNGWIAA
jgi:hypothetical protein